MIDPDKLAALDAAATPGPWEVRPDEYDDWGFIRAGKGGHVVAIARGGYGMDHDKCRRDGIDPYGPNAALTAYLRNAVPDILSLATERATLLSQLEEAREECARLREALEPFSAIAQGEIWERFIADSKMVLRISNGAGDRHYSFINAECFEAVRAALTKGPSDEQG